MASGPITGTMYTDTTHADSAHGADHTSIHTALSAVAALIFTGTATPEGAVTAPQGSLFLRTDGVAATTLYAKVSGSGNTGWLAFTAA